MAGVRGGSAAAGAATACSTFPTARASGTDGFCVSGRESAPSGYGALSARVALGSPDPAHRVQLPDR